MNGAHSGFHVAVSRKHDRRRRIAQFPQLGQKLKAIHTRHVQVGHNHVGRKTGYLFQRFGAFGRCLRGHVPRLHHSGKASALAGLVVHNQYFEELIHLFYYHPAASNLLGVWPL